MTRNRQQIEAVIEMHLNQARRQLRSARETDISWDLMRNFGLAFYELGLAEMHLSNLEKLEARHEHA